MLILEYSEVVKQKTKNQRKTLLEENVKSICK